MKDAVTKVMDTLTQKDFNGAFQKFLERYKCIATGGDYYSFVCVLSIKVPIRKKYGNLFNDTRIWFGWVGFYGMSTIVGYLMPNPLYTYTLNIYDLVWLGFVAYQQLEVI